MILGYLGGHLASWRLVLVVAAQPRDQCDVSKQRIKCTAYNVVEGSWRAGTVFEDG